MKDITIPPKATIRWPIYSGIGGRFERNTQHSLIGSLTDGDIRRYILKGRNLTSVTVPISPPLVTKVAKRPRVLIWKANKKQA